MSAEFMSIANTLASIQQLLAQVAKPGVGAGAACSYFEPESAEWQDAIFHKWCEIHACPEPAALIHDRLTGVCLLVRMQNLRFKKDST